MVRKKMVKDWDKILDNINWKFLCVKYDEYSSECSNNRSIKSHYKDEYHEYMRKWNELKLAWIRGNSTDRLRLYSSGHGSSQISITYFLEFFNRDKLCFGYCKPGLDSRFLKIYRLPIDNKELYYVDGESEPCGVETAAKLFSEKLEKPLNDFITTTITSEQELVNLLEKKSNKDFIKYYSPSQFLYKIIMLNTIPNDFESPISHPMLFTNSHEKINHLLARLGIEHKFGQRISLDRFKFTHAFVMKYWSKLKKFRYQNVDSETPNIIQTEFMSWVCSRIYSDDPDFNEIGNVQLGNTESVNEIDDYKFQQELNLITDYETEKKVDVTDEPRDIEYSENSENDSNDIHYKRHRERAINALRFSDFRCEVDIDHPTFIKRNSNTRYVECHHLIPMEQQVNFDNSLDTEANIVTLCSNCHNQIHYGKGAEQLLKKLYEARKKRLESSGIGVSFEELLKMYRLK